VNVVILIGNICRDVELRHTQDGVPVTTFTVAVNRPAPKDSQERKADFIDVVVWRNQAENCAKYLSKGRKVSVTGRLRTRTYEESKGIKRKVVEVEAKHVYFLDSKNGSGARVEHAVPGEENVPPHLMGGAGGGLDEFDDELPF